MVVVRVVAWTELRLPQIMVGQVETLVILLRPGMAEAVEQAMMVVLILQVQIAHSILPKTVWAGS